MARWRSCWGVNFSGRETAEPVCMKRCVGGLVEDTRRGGRQGWAQAEPQGSGELWPGQCPKLRWEACYERRSITGGGLRKVTGPHVSQTTIQ